MTLSKKEKIERKLKKYGLTEVNKAKPTPGHPTKSHVVLAKKGDEVKLIRFGQQGVKGAGKNPRTKAEKQRRASYYARHNAQNQIQRYFHRYFGHIRSNGNFHDNIINKYYDFLCQTNQQGQILHRQKLML